MGRGPARYSATAGRCQMFFLAFVGNAERAGLSLGEMRKADNRDLLQAYLLTSLRPSMSGQNGQVFVDQNRNIEAKGLDAARNLRNLAPIEFKNA